MPTVQYSATTGKKLKKGETTTQSGKTYTQGQTYGSSSSSKAPKPGEKGFIVQTAAQAAANWSTAAKNAGSLNLLSPAVAKQVASGGFKSGGLPSNTNLLSPAVSRQVSSGGFSSTSSGGLISGTSSVPSGNFYSTSSLTSGTRTTPTSNVINAPSVLNPDNNKITFPEPKVADYSQYIPTSIEQERLDIEAEQKDTQEDYLSDLLKDFKDKPTGVEIDRKLQRDLGIKQKQQLVSDLTGQLNGIVAKGQANQLSLVGQGRGIPEAIIGGQQAEIGRETAIAALPVQAQLSAAQGNLEMANDSLDRLFKIYSEEAQNEFNFKREVRKSVYDFATSAQKRKLDDLDKQEARMYDEKQSNINMLNDWQKTALATGQKSLFTQMSKINPSSPTFRQDLAKLQVQIVTAMKSPEAPVTRDFNGTTLQWDSASGQWITPPGSSSSIVGGVDKIQQSKDQLKFLRDTAKQASDLAGASGPSFITRTLGDTFIGDTRFRQLEALTNTLKTNMLTLATDPNIKKFFGPQMSNADVLLMTSAGTTINPSANSPTTLKAEIARLDSLFNRMQTAIDTGSTGGNIITAPTGELILITD